MAHFLFPLARFSLQNSKISGTHAHSSCFVSSHHRMASDCRRGTGRRLVRRVRSDNSTPFTRRENSRNVETTTHSTVFLNRLYIDLTIRTAIVEFIRRYIACFAHFAPFWGGKQTGASRSTKLFASHAERLPTHPQSIPHSVFAWRMSDRRNSRLYFRSSSAPRQGEVYTRSACNGSFRVLQKIR